MNNDWLQGIVTFIRKNKDPLYIDNYRPITLPNMIYKYGRAYSETDKHHYWTY